MKHVIKQPHKEQDGWVYIRVLREMQQDGVLTTHSAWGSRVLEVAADYPDVPLFPEHRIISSRRVERAVETDDYLRLCAEEGLTVVRDRQGPWYVGLYTAEQDPIGGQRRVGAHGYSTGSTLREAYWRYKAVAK